MKSYLKYIVLVLIVCLSLSAWPIYIIGLSIWGISKIVRNDFKYREVCLLLLVLFISISVGEMTMRIIGHHQTYGEINDDAINHIVFTNYQSPFVSAQKGRGWFYVHDGHSIFESKEVNKEGLSDIDHSIQKTKKRVIVLGDSFTEGAGSTNDSNYVHLLGRCRNDFEFINAGIAGSDPAFELRLLEGRLLKYNPDLVIMSVNSTDINDFMMRGGMERFLSDSTVSFRTGRWWEFAYGKSFVIRSIAYNVSHLDHNLMSESDVLIYKSKAMSQLTQVIETASLECHQRNIRFIVNFHPLNMEVHNAYMECTPIMDSLRSNHIETFDMLSYFIGHGINPTNAEDYYLPFDRHHNNKGYAIMAQGLSELF